MDTNDWAQTHETDERIAEAIVACLANGELDTAERIWQNPEDYELMAIWQHATDSGRLDDTAMQWGVSTLHEIVGQRAWSVIAALWFGDMKHKE